MDSSDSFRQSDDSPYQERVNAQWMAAVALRDTIGIVSERPTYEQILGLADELAPDLFGRHNLLAQERESLEAREYRQMADALSADEGRLVSPSEATTRDIEKIRRLLTGKSTTERDLLKRRLYKLEQVLKEFEKRPYTENQLIVRDAYVGDTLPIALKGDGYHDIALPGGRVMRIRLIHPDPPENILGVDLLYEHHHIAKEQVRLAALQYKRWHKNVFYTSDDPRTEQQLERLQKAFCKNNLCQEVTGRQDKSLYRLPYCSAFLRLTDKLQYPEARFATGGYHIPICVVERSWQATLFGNLKLTMEDIKHESVNTNVFEEMFNAEMLGSRWISYQELEDLYQQYNLLKLGENIIIHAQDFVPRRY